MNFFKMISMWFGFGKEEAIITIIEGEGKIMKRALHVGINNYPGTQNDLKGCVNDAQGWRNLLKGKYGFEINKVLLDNQATKKAVTKSLEKLINESKSGDVLVVTYSGHGTSVRDGNGDEADQTDEAWCMYDSILIDDDIQKIISKVPEGVSLTVISDSCFSGSVTRSFMATLGSEEYSKPRYMPPQSDQDAVESLVFKSESSFGKTEKDMEHILLSGTDDKSYSYDATINGQNCGAFSYYSIEILKNNPKITYKEFYKKLKDALPSSRFPQNPQLEGKDENKNKIMFS